MLADKFKIVIIALPGTTDLVTLEVLCGADDILATLWSRYPPRSMADASGKVTGFDADVGNRLCTALDRDCKFVFQAFDGLVPALKAHRLDIIISSMSITEEGLQVRRCEHHQYL